MVGVEQCERCGHALEVLRHPVKRLRWTRYWWEGFKSLFTGQLRICGRCGAIYSGEGELLAAGAVETEAERRLNVYRKDMAHLRDAFGAVVIAAEIVVLWMVLGPEPAALSKVVLSAGVGVTSLIPFAFFGRRAQLAKRELRALREVRRRGALAAGPEA